MDDSINILRKLASYFGRVYRFFCDKMLYKFQMNLELNIKEVIVFENFWQIFICYLEAVTFSKHNTKS